MGQLLSQTDFARHRGVGKSAVSNWKKAGMIVFADDGAGRLLVDVMRTEARLNARIDPTRGRPSTSSPDVVTPDLAAIGDQADGSPLAQRNLALVRAEVAEEDLIGRRLRNAESARELVPAMEAERRLAELGRMAFERVKAELRSSAERNPSLTLEPDMSRLPSVSLLTGVAPVAFAMADAGRTPHFPAAIGTRGPTPAAPAAPTPAPAPVVQPAPAATPAPASAQQDPAPAQPTPAPGLGPVLRDGKTLFHPDHGNIVLPGGPLSVDQVEAMDILFAAQTDLTGADVLDIRLSMQLVPYGAGDQASKLDAMLAAIGSAVIADRTLGGVCDWADISPPDEDDISPDGAPTQRWATLEVVLTYSTTNPLG